VTPKGSFEYTNVHYTLAGRIVDAVSGYHWKDYLAKRIFEPAGMKNATCFADEMYERDDVAIPTSFENGTMTPTRVRKTNRTMHAAGGIGASASDLANWLKVNLGDGRLGDVRLLSEKNIRAMQTLEAKGRSGAGMPGRKRKGYGLGWFVGDYRGETLLEHGGGYVGTSAMISIIPDKKIGVAIVANSDVPLPIIASNEVLDRLLGLGMEDNLPRLKMMLARRAKMREERADKLGKNPATAEDGLSLAGEEYAGVYTNVDLGSIKVAFEDGELVAHMGDLPMDLASSGTDRFAAFAEIDELTNGRFEVSDNRKVETIAIQMDDPIGEVRFEKR
jgi:CubicO group peptidase (beta-lactamase class C family)